LWIARQGDSSWDPAARDRRAEPNLPTRQNYQRAGLSV